jgi:hypothetical protein
MLPLAHAGHWLADVMYVLPVVAVAIWIGIRALLDRRAAKRASPSETPGPARPPAGDPPH